MKAPVTLRNYRLTDKIGEGGQGEVYKAIDTKLGRTVVIKLLPPELTARSASLKRFEREARLASSLDHPNICTIFDLDEANGTHYIAMQYVAGQNVRQLVNGRPLELRSALLIAIQVADALAAAHERGIIHRDIKAGNVMVTESGSVKILDFGLAKLVEEESADSASDRTHLTEIGVPYGTATYAAPEQSRGDPVDARADIFSTGVLLYEMLTGTWPFHGKSSVEVRHAVMHVAPKPLAQARPGLCPPRLQQILDRALAKNAQDRYSKMAGFRDELRFVLQEITAGASGQEAGSVTPESPRHLAGGAVAKAKSWLRSLTRTDSGRSSSGSGTRSARDIHLTPATVAPDRTKKSIAILPFRNLSNDAASAFYEFSLADAVITELARVRSLIVRPSSLIAKYQGSTADPRAIGREIDADAILSAGFLLAGERLRVTAQLLDVSSGEIHWSDRIDAASADIISLQDTIAGRIVEGLRVQLTTDEEVELKKPATENVSAYEEYLRGRDRFARFIFRTVAAEDCDAAIAHFKRAIDLDPGFALAYDGLGACHINRVLKGIGSSEDFVQAEAAFRRALDIDPGIMEAKMLMVFVYLWRGQIETARTQIANALIENPNEAVIHFVKATLHRLSGEYDRALRSYERLARLDPPARVVVACNRALILITLGRFDDALADLEKASAEEPANPLVQAIRALAFCNRGDAEEGAAIAGRVVAGHKAMHGIRPIYALCLSRAGRHEAALAQLDEHVLRNAGVDPDIAYMVASVYALEGKRDDAIQWLATSKAMGNRSRLLFERDPNLESLRGDPAFQEIFGDLG